MEAMIGYLNGEVIQISGNKLIVNCGGVGYSVSVVKPEKFLLNQETKLFVHTYVKEDALALFGFLEAAEVALFEKLLSVSGVGPKVAMSVFKAGSESEIKKAIRVADVSFFTGVSGIGKKGAQRIIVELKSKLGDEKDLDLSDSPQQADALKGLLGLGFSKAEAVEALKKVDKELSVEEQIKLALKHG